ncbi:hypothetical protein NDU88_003903 [Pleurodeles waltl]|uniref:Uncharacterized protein n=1 Tax=Pleurodeles waltl TaxID=8319 RepID=A0AAV7WSK0_PLEWA|nr:hypothetical protein NDU88_003903 [Pleurodeles waltl]
MRQTTRRWQDPDQLRHPDPLRHPDQRRQDLDPPRHPDQLKHLDQQQQDPDQRQPQHHQLLARRRHRSRRQSSLGPGQAQGRA